MLPALRSLVLKSAWLGTPLFILIALYVITDPFAVLRRPRDYYTAGEVAPRNRDFVSSETLLARTNSSHYYDSFVFGSSRSIPFQTEDWRPYLSENAHPFHFDASLESLFGIWSKVRYLDRAGYALRNALLVVDGSLLGRPADDDHRAMFLKDPTVAGTSWFSFHLAMFEGFLGRGFFVAYVDHSLFGKWRPYMKSNLSDHDLGYLPDTNDILVQDREDDIARMGEAYFQTYEFDDQDPQPGQPAAATIRERGRQELTELGDIFARQKTNVRILVSPMYDRRPLNHADREVLVTAFGSSSVRDFSGDNWVTRDRHNYYDKEHFRLAIARILLSKAYSADQTTTPGLEPIKTGSK
jgi:hypothetical protein